MSDWDELRSQLAPCSCGAKGVALRFHTWRMGGGCHIWCTACGLGSPEKPDTAEMAQLECGEDGRPLAVEFWNKARASGYELRASIGRAGT